MQSGELFVGRDEEVRLLEDAIDGAGRNEGGAVLVVGEAGIGKTALLNHVLSQRSEKETLVFKGNVEEDHFEPYKAFADALEGVVEKDLFTSKHHNAFLQVFAVDKAGILMAKGEGQEDLDGDIFAGMFSAVQQFIADSFDREGGLGRLEYGDMKILLEHGEKHFLAGVFKGEEHPLMKIELKKTLAKQEKVMKGIQGEWDGEMSVMQPIKRTVRQLMEKRFPVRRELRGDALEEERLRVAEATLSALLDHSKEGPVILVLENLQWARTSGLFLFDYIARNASESKILVLGTARQKKKMNLKNIAAEVKLKGLDKEDVNRMINETLSPNNFPETLSHNLTEKCRGNPLFISEFMEHMKAEGNIVKEEGTFLLADQEYSVPHSVEDTVEMRFFRMDPATVALAEYLSLVGPEFPPSALDGFNMNGKETALKDLEEYEILLKKDENLHFAQSLFRECLSKNISPRWRVFHHRNIGEHYERQWQDRLDEVIFKLAHHFYHAGEDKKAFEYNFRAGEKAEAEYALESALKLYGRALEKGPKVPAKTRADIHERMGDVSRTVGDFEGSLNHYDQTMKLGAKNDGRVMRKKAKTLVSTGKYEEALELLEKAKGFLENDVVQLTSVLETVAEIRMRKGDFQGLEENLVEGKATATDQKYEKGRMNLTHLLGNLHWFQGHFDRAERFYAEASAMAEKLNDEMGISRSRNNLGVIQMERGELDKAEKNFQEALALDKKMGRVADEALILDNIADIYDCRGDLEAALDYHEQALNINKRIDYKEGVAWSIIGIANEYNELENYRKAIESFHEAITTLEEIDNQEMLIHAYYGLAESYNEVENFEKAVEYAEMSMDLARKNGKRREEGVTHHVFGLIFMKKGDLTEAGKRFQASRKIMEENKDELILAQLDYEEGRLEMKKGNADRGVELMKRSLEKFKKIGHGYWANKIEKEIADQIHKKA